MTFFNLGHSVQLHFTIGQNLLDQTIEQFMNNLPRYIQIKLKQTA